MNPKTEITSFYNASKLTLGGVSDMAFAQDAKANAYRIKPKKGTAPILHVLVHAPSGSGDHDKEKRKAVLLKPVRPAQRLSKSNAQRIWEIISS